MHASGGELDPYYCIPSPLDAAVGSACNRARRWPRGPYPHWPGNGRRACGGREEGEEGLPFREAPWVLALHLHAQRLRPEGPLLPPFGRLSAVSRTTSAIRCSLFVRTGKADGFPSIVQSPIN